VKKKARAERVGNAERPMRGAYWLATLAVLMRRPKEVFLSHAHRDRRFAKKLAKMLRRHKLKVWYSETHIAGGARWHDVIGRALDRCDWFLLVLSRNAVQSEWVKHELLYALNEPRYKGRILPVLIEACDPKPLSWVLGEFQRVDFTRDPHEACRRLLRTWHISFDGKF
jgi:hypothetical protein